MSGTQGGLSAADLIDSFATGEYTVTRRAAASYVKGRAQSGPPAAPFTIRASVQPASGRDLQRLPEGRRSIETRVLYTTTRLVVGGQAAPSEADRVEIDGKAWEVQSVESWPSADGYFKCIVQSSALG